MLDRGPLQVLRAVCVLQALYRDPPYPWPWRDTARPGTGETYSSAVIVGGSYVASDPK
jgi:hypothetical protein